MAPSTAAAWAAGFEAGALAMLKVLEGKAGAAELARRVGLSASQLKRWAMAEVLRRPGAKAPTGETPAEKSARLSRTRRQIRDAELARELAAHVLNGKTTEAARSEMGIGVVRAQRVRALAVKMGLLAPRQIGPAK